MADAQYFGKYRGTVLLNADPENRGRLIVIVPDVLNILPSSWALPCFPFTGMQSGFFVVPEIGSGVWVEFEQGDPDYPIWSGGWFGSTEEVPSLALASGGTSQTVVIQTTGQNTLMISDLPGPSGGILLKTASGAAISISDSGIVS